MRIFLAQLMERPDIFVIGYRCYRTGVDDNSIRIPVHNLVPAGCSQLRQRLRFKQVYLTSQCKKSKLHFEVLPACPLIFVLILSYYRRNANQKNNSGLTNRCSGAILLP